MVMHPCGLLKQDNSDHAAPAVFLKKNMIKEVP